jgi:hypothetical protein
LYIGKIKSVGASINKMAPGKGLGDGLADGKMLGAGDYETSAGIRFVEDLLKIGEEFRGTLGIVENGAVGKTRQKAAGIREGNGACIRVLKRNIGFVWEGVAGKRGLAALARTGERNGLVATGPLAKDCLQNPRNHDDMGARADLSLELKFARL